jgi:ketosteroid isomerase-like protein
VTGSDRDKTRCHANPGEVTAMDEVESFLAEMLPRFTEADTRLHNGDARARKALWSRSEPVTLFGAAVTTSGWSEISPAFDWLGTTFSDCRHFDYEVVAAGVSGDLAYVAGIEHTTASIGGREPAPYSLRVTTVLRREDGEWKVVHRHADPVPDDTSARAPMSDLRALRQA